MNRKAVISLILIIVILLKISPIKVIKNISYLSITCILSYILLYLISLFFKALQFSSLLSVFSKNSLLNIYGYIIISTLYGKISPGNIGELYRGELIAKKYNINRSKSYLIVVIDKAISFLSSLILIIVYLISFNKYIKKEYIYIISIFLIFFLVMLIFIMIMRKRIAPKLIPYLPKKYKKKIKKLLKEIDLSINIIKKNKIKVMISTLFSITFWQIGSIINLFLLNCFGYSVNIAYFTIASIITMLITMIPISFGGIGTRELTLLSFLNEIPKSIIVSFSFSLYSLNIISLLIVWVSINIKKFLK